jgi:DNA-binding MarR family transcriptional regulator
MSPSLPKRQHDVNESVRPKRTAAGEAFTDLVLEVAWLGGIFTNIGERLAKGAGQTLARWVILDAIEEQPSTVARIARRRGIARQAVQRVADLLERDGLAVYEPNPGHRRARLLRPTERGRESLRTINVAQKAWSDALGHQISEAKLRKATGLVSEIRQAVQAGQSSTDADP